METYTGILTIISIAATLYFSADVTIPHKDKD